MGLAICLDASVAAAFAKTSFSFLPCPPRSWFNTFFVQEDKMVAPKMTIDKANKDKKHKIYPESFAVEFQFETPAELRAETQEAEAEVANTSGSTVRSA